MTEYLDPAGKKPRKRARGSGGFMIIVGKKRTMYASRTLHDGVMHEYSMLDNNITTVAIVDFHKRIVRSFEREG